MTCYCYPKRLLCGSDGGLDFTEWMPSEEGPKGPASFRCKDIKGERKCELDGIYLLENVLILEKNLNAIISRSLFLTLVSSVIHLLPCRVL